MWKERAFIIGGLFFAVVVASWGQDNKAETPLQQLRPAAATGPAAAAKPAAPRVAVADLPLKAEVDEKAWCDVYLLKDSPRDLLVFDQHGKLIQDARQVYIWFQIATHDPIAKIYRWEGIYRPATAIEENWRIRKLEIVSSPDFMKMVELGVVSK